MHSSDTVADCLHQLLQTPEACMLTCASLASPSSPAVPLALSLPLSTLLPASATPVSAQDDQPQPRPLTLLLIPAIFDHRSARCNVARLHEILTAAVITPASALYSSLATSASPSIPIDPSAPPTFSSITEIHSWKFGTLPSSPPCICALRLSPTNPPAPFRRIRGDLFYLDVTLSDGASVAITASTSGFCLRLSDDSHSASRHDAAPSHTYHPSIAACLSSANPRFKSNFARLVAEQFKRDPCEMVPSTTFARPSWLVTHVSKDVVYIDAQLLGDAVICQRDWNEDVFGLLALPQDDAVGRDRNIIKTQVDFMEAAKAVAVAAIDGVLAPVNPLEDTQLHIYIANNMFASRCVDNFDAAASRCARPLLTHAVLLPAHACCSSTPQEVASFSCASRDVAGSLAYPPHP
jgi:hypothetical protein